MKRIIVFALLAVLSLSACVSKKKFGQLQEEQDQLELRYSKLQEECNKKQDKANTEAARLREEIARSEARVALLEAQLGNEKSRSESMAQQLEYFKGTNQNLLDRLADLSVVSQEGAASIKESLQAINEQNRYIQNLNASMQRKDSLTLALVMNLKRSLSDVNDEDVTVEVKKGVVYISLSDKMLFKSGSYEISSAAESVLGKIARIVNDHADLDILVEGHTDNVPISNSCVKDNWDLSVMRATSVVRLLQKKYGVAASRMTAGGRSEFVPKANNDSAANRSLNRRTEIIILPKLDQFFQLLTPGGGSGQ